MKCEGELVKQILDYYKDHPNITLWRNNTGAIRKNGRVIQYGKVGSGDITGITYGGRRVEIECKKPGNTTSKDRQQKQDAFGDMIIKHCGIYIRAKSLDDVVFVLEK